MMKKFFYLLAVVCATGFFSACSDDDDNLPQEGAYRTIDFEGSKWNALIDNPQYGGKLLYGDSGYGFATDEGVYEWTDEATGLHSKLANAWDSWCYWNGGVAVSNYHCDVADGSSTTQLSIPTDLKAHSGENFVMAFSNTELDFKDGKSRKVKGLWITNSSYFLHSENEGDGYNTPASNSTYVDVVFEGMNASGNSTGTVKYRIQDGKASLTNWAHVNLSSLGEISSLKISYDYSDDQANEYGMTAPAYIAIDDVEIYE